MQTDYRWSRLTTDDGEAWAALANTLAEVDDTDEFVRAEDLTEELTDDGVDPTRDTWAVWDGERLVAFGGVRVSPTLGHDGTARAWFLGGVHPDHRGRGIGRRLVAQLEARGRELTAERHPGQPAVFVSDAGREDSSSAALLRHRGYAVVRYFNQLVRPLPGEVPAQPEVPTNVRLVPVSDDLKETVREAHNAAFRDHFGSSEVPPAAWDHRWAARASRHDLSSLAVDGAGRVLAYVLCQVWEEGELYVATVGTVAEARGRGLAQACLARSLRLAVDEGGFTRADLHVDSASPTGATRLYARLGFETARVFARFERPQGEVSASRPTEGLNRRA